MGSEHSKNSETSSDSRNSQDLSSDKKRFDNKKHIKIVTYNMKITSFSENKFNNILMYLVYEKKNIIYCLQGLYDLTFRKKLMEALNEKHSENFSPVNIIPKINNINQNIEDSGLFFISTYPVINYDIYLFPRPNISILKSIDKYQKGILTVNLYIHKHIVSVYNVSFQSDLKLNILNCKDIRHEQIKLLLEKINGNIENVKKMDSKLSNIHIIIGSLYDPVLNNKILDSIDIKPINWDDENSITQPYTNINDKKKYEYIYFYLYNYDNNTKTDILEYFKELKIEIIENRIKTNIVYTENMPYEIIFKISK